MLSVRELAVLEMLMARVGRVVTKRQITANSLSAWDADFSENAVEVYACTACASALKARAPSRRCAASATCWMWKRPDGPAWPPDAGCPARLWRSHPTSS